MNARDNQEDLLQEQIKLEEEMTRKGAERYLRDVAAAKQSGREEGTAYGQSILSGRLDVLAQAISKWMAECSTGEPKHHATSYKRVKDMDSYTLAFLTLKNVLSGVSSLRTLQFVGVAIGTAIEDEIRFAKIREDEKRKFDKLCEGAAKRVSQFNKHIYAVRLAEHMQDGWTKWSRTDRLHVGVKMLDLVMSTIGIVELAHQKVEKDQSKKYIRPTQDTLEWIEKKNDVASLMRPVYEPMVVTPRDWTNPFDGGYLSSNIKPLRMVKTKNRAYLEELREVDMPIVYSAINSLQRSPWQINQRVLSVMKELWETGSTLADLPSRDGVELPPKPLDIDTNETAKKEWKIKAAKAHVHNLSLAGKRVAFSISLSIAQRYARYDRIYFPYQLDFRGRIYAVPHLNPQGADHQKALLQFAEGKPLGTEGWKWLAIHGANLAGNDKVTLEDRVNWVLDNEDEILAIAANPYDNRGWCKEVGGVSIDKPWQFLSFCFEWAGYCEQGDDYISCIPVAMDGSCSGLQHFSAMLKDEVGGAAVNLVPADLPADVYQLVANKVKEKVQHLVEFGTEDTLKHNEDGTPWVNEGTKALAKQWQAFGITRKTTKRSVMTLAYGSKEYGFREQLMEDIITPARLACQKTGGDFPFARDGYAAAQFMAKLIWQAVQETLVKSAEAMRWLQSAASLAASEQLPVRWTTPIGFPVMQAYPDVEPRRVKTAINGKVVYLRMFKDKDKLDRRRQSQGISPNFIHSADAAHLMLTVVRASQDGITNFAMIHDSFGTTAGDAENMFYIVRNSFVEMYGTLDVLGEFRSEISQQLSEKNRLKLDELPSSGTLDIQGVLESRYCFA
jgi:DNA-directed RNA polymerase, mitochondrial